MTDLKTLKDLDVIDHQGRKGYGWQCIDIEQLKQEAIKWVKFRMNRKANTRDREIIFWCDRFNITEEELK